MIPRTLLNRLTQLAGPFPVVFLTGPRQSGKTTLARAAFPQFQYISLEDMQNREEAAEDPRGFLHRLEGRGAILDEIQRAQDPPGSVVVDMFLNRKTRITIAMRCCMDP
jgi:uncharacterized protein